MRLSIISALLTAMLASVACAPPSKPANPPLAWAYPTSATPSTLPDPPPGLQHVPGSTVALTKAQVSDEQNPPDWFPHEHPPAPDIVAHGHPAARLPAPNAI